MRVGPLPAVVVRRPGAAGATLSAMRRLAILLLCTVPVLAQHDITQVEPAPPGTAIATPIPTTRGWR